METRIHSVPGKGRIVAIRLADLTLRCMENWRALAGGYDEAMILVAVVAITSPRLAHQNIPQEYQSLDCPLPDTEFAPCNVASIAAATGLNRETTRRKVDKLVEARFLQKEARGNLRLRRGLVQEEATQDLIAAQLEAIRRLAENFIRDGVFRISAGKSA